MTKKQEEQKRELVKSLNKFHDWLVRRKIIKNPKNKKDKVHYVDFPFSHKDFLMEVKGQAVSFNTYALDEGKCSFDYYTSMVLHEFFHLVVQKVPNKEDATRVKDDFGDELMKLIDIESDFYVAVYYKEVLGYDLVDYLSLYFDGRKVFPDKRIRAIKFERFLGTALSIAKMFIDHPKPKQQVTHFDLYHPTISPVYTEESLHVLVVKKEHIYIDEIKGNYTDFVELKRCFSDIEGVTRKGYVDALVRFCCKAFDIPVPERVQAEIELLS